MGNNRTGGSMVDITGLSLSNEFLTNISYFVGTKEQYETIARVYMNSENKNEWVEKHIEDIIYDRGVVALVCRKGLLLKMTGSGPYKNELMNYDDVILRQEEQEEIW